MDVDLYTKISEAEGVDRGVVKYLALPLMYDFKVGTKTQQDLENQLVKIVRFYKKMMDANDSTID